MDPTDLFSTSGSSTSPTMVTPPSYEMATFTKYAAILWLLDAASIGLSAYHGYKRNRGSVGAAIGWGLLGGFFPVLTPAVAFAQGFSKPK